ncbi:hypothetical protein [Roseivivax sediminis]|uniref:Arginine transporter n=1 Tax=Roseivivax sediminis TaxID=936889 RepID=A0A1I1WHI4_9RHOB|nr:hypothetical protein [Roseivivax sediminis]SFD93858.1 hypothetical protein SAMN04515678_104292 [Roseivivax sediminis]
MKAIPLVLAVCALTLSACGQRETVTRSASFSTVNLANGPLRTACLRSDRPKRNPQLCGCIQGVADRVLTSSEQRVAESFYRDPHQAQVIRQSDRQDDERLWSTYTRFVRSAERSCSAL